jgi:peptide methionine sulfoxide reductase MsrA
MKVTQGLPGRPSLGSVDYHQQYLAKNPNGYCNIGPNGVSCPVGCGPPSSKEM